MERTREEPDDRAVRDQLEAIQVELREVRAALVLARQGEPAEVATLRASIADAERAVAQETTRAADLDRHAAEGDARAEKLRADIEEAKVLALGASRRDEDLEWLPSSGGPLPEWVEWARIIFILLALAFIVVATLAGVLVGD